MALVILLLFLVIVGFALSFGRHLPRSVQVSILMVLSLVLAFVHASVAHNQLHTSGFAGSVRTPNHPAEIIGYLLAAVGLLNTVLACIRLRYAAAVLAVLLITLPILFFISW